MDLRDEVAGTDGTIWINNFLRTGFEMFSAGGSGGYVSEKSEADRGWMFPVGDEAAELGYIDMFTDMFRSLEAGSAPRETFYDGYVVNAVMDAAFKSARSRAWEPVQLSEWRGGTAARIGSGRAPETHDGPGRHQARDPARRPPQADPQGPRDGRLTPIAWSRLRLADRLSRPSVGGGRVALGDCASRAACIKYSGWVTARVGSLNTRVELLNI